MNLTCCIVLSAFLAYSSSASAQSIGPAVVNATGGEAEITGAAYEYAVGQLTTGETGSAGGILITPEVLQPRIRSNGIIEQVSESALSVFPNPASTTLFLQPGLQPGSVLRYALYDAAGRIVARGNASLAQGTEQQALRVETLTPGIYTLQTSWTTGGDHYDAAFKVQKQ